MAFTDNPYGELVTTTARIMTWNVWGRFGPWGRREDAITSVVRQVDPDIVFLQECWCDDAGANQADRLGERLGLHASYGGGELLFGSWGLGSGVLSRWPLRDLQHHALPALDEKAWGGAALRAITEGPRGPILLYCVALDWPPHASVARQHALRALATLVDADVRSAKAPLIVGGDFNAGPESDEIRMLTGRRETAQPGFVLFDAWAHHDGGDADHAGVTWSNDNPWTQPKLLPSQRIDYLFTGWPRRGGVGSVVSARRAGIEPIDGVVASDHYAVVADIRY